MASGLKAHATVRGSAAHTIPGLSRDNKCDPSVKKGTRTESCAHGVSVFREKFLANPGDHGKVDQPVPASR